MINTRLIRLSRDASGDRKKRSLAGALPDAGFYPSPHRAMFLVGRLPTASRGHPLV